MKDRAYSVLEIKEIDDEQRVIRGIATTPSTDRVGDIVEPLGVKVAPDIPMFLYHDSRMTVGRARFGKATKTGIPFEATIPKVKEPGRLQDRVDEAWQMLKYRLITAVSIGFNVLEDGYEIMKNGGIHYLKTEVLELSLVPVPAQAEATITSIKSIDDALLAASGREQGGGGRGDDLPGASGARKSAASSGFFLNPRSQKGNDMTLAEQLAALKAARQAKAEKMATLMTAGAGEGRTTDADEAKAFDELEREVAKADEDIGRLEKLVKLNVQQAAPLNDDGTDVQRGGAVDIGAGGVLRVKRNTPKGTGFTRYAMALAGTKGNVFEALAYVQGMMSRKQWDDTPEVLTVLKAASDAGSTTDTDFASKLVYAQDLASEFVDLLRPITILGKFGTTQRFGNQTVAIPALRRIPFNVRMATQTGGGTYGWVGEGAPKPVGELIIGEITMRWAKAAGIIVLTKELARFSNPAAEEVVRRDMLNGMAAFSDLQFISPQVFEVANVSPASVTNGVTDVPATGTDADALRTDLATLFGKFWTANMGLGSGVFLMSQRQATAISLMRNALGQKEYPDMTPLGGMLEGFPVIASEAIPDDSGGGMIVLLNADDVYFADDGPVTIDASQEATLQMNTTPDATTTAATVLVSLWQRNMVALRAERFMNWKKRRAAAVQYISSAAYK